MRKPKEVGYKQLEEDFPGFAGSGKIVFDMPPKYGQMSLVELSILSRIVENKNPDHIFEFGRCDGVTTTQLALAAPEAYIYTLDLPEAMGIYSTSSSANARAKWIKFGVASKIFEILADSRTLNAGDFAGRFDVILIDAGHEMDEIRIDTENAYKMARPGAVIIWHDYFKRSFPAVTSFLAEKAEELDIRWINSREEYLETSLCYAFA